MNRKNRAILYGLALGDGHVSYRTRLKDGKYRYEQAELVIGHSYKQKEYIEYKADLIHSILGGKRPKVSLVRHTLNNGKTYTGYRIAKTNRYFRGMHRLLYGPSRKKRISGQLTSYLDEKSLTLLFMDDGHIRSNKNKKGEVTSLSFEISTYLDDIEDCETLCEWIQSYGIDCKPFTSKNKYCIKGNTHATLTLCSVIGEHIIPSMQYKIFPVTQFVIRKSAKHPNFHVDEDIVQSAKNSICS